MRKVTKNGHTFMVSDPPFVPEFWDLVERGQWEPETFDILDRSIQAGNDLRRRRSVDWANRSVCISNLPAMLRSRTDPRSVFPILKNHLMENQALNVCPRGKQRSEISTVIFRWVVTCLETVRRA